MSTMTTVRRGDRPTLEKSLLLVLALSTATFALAAVLTPPASGYEGSLYAAYPLPFWGLLVVGLGAALLLFLLASFGESRRWVAGLVLLLLLYGVFLLLPIFRGYALYGRYFADVLTHLGIAGDIVDSGRLSGVDWYPVAHLLAAEFALLGVPLRWTQTLLTAFMTPVYVLGVFLLARKLLGNTRIGLVVLAVAVPLVYSKFHHTFHPAFFSFMLLPLFFVGFVGLYRSTGQRRVAYIVYAVLFGLTLVLFHPVTSMYVVAALVVSALVHGLVRMAGTSRRMSALGARIAQLNLDVSLQLKLAGGLAVLWAAWYLQFDRILDFAQSVFAALTGNAPSETVATAYGTEAVAGLPLSKIVLGFLTEYGPIFLVLTLAALGMLSFLRRTLGGSGNRLLLEESWLASQFVTGFGFAVVTLFAYVIAFNPVRNSRYMILMATPIAGLVVYRLLHHAGRSTVRRAATAFVVVLLVGASGVAVANTYQFNYHLTYGEEYGTTWVYDNRAAGDDVAAAAMHVSYKMQVYVEGEDHDTMRMRNFGSEYSIARGFGYDQYPSVGAQVGEGGESWYIATKPYDLQSAAYLDERLRDDWQQYSATDLERLAVDSAVDRVYSNGGYDVWYVPE